MNIYDQYLALLHIFFHRENTKAVRREQHAKKLPTSDKVLFKDAA